VAGGVLALKRGTPTTPHLNHDGTSAIEPTGLLKRWEEELAILRRRGVAEAAVSLEQCIRELREWCRERALEALTLTEAADYSGLSSETIRKKVARGELQNVGAKNRPRVRRCDLPARPLGSPKDSCGALHLADEILARRISIP
jgi:hypothetical protein